MSKYSVERTDHLQQTLPERRRENAYVAQMPVPYSTLGNKQIYFQPGIDMRKPGEHPAHLTNARLPNPTSTHIQWLDGMLNGLGFQCVNLCNTLGGLLYATKEKLQNTQLFPNMCLKKIDIEGRECLTFMLSRY